MNQQNTNATLRRRFAAMIYDLLLLVGVLLVASAIAVAINRGTAVSHPLYYLSIPVITFIFYGWFWTHGGQTLGLRTWKLQLTGISQEPVSWKQATIRYLAAFASFLPAGAGFFWMLFDRDRLTLHDRLSSTRIIKLDKPAAKDH